MGGSAVRATRPRINARRRLRHREAIDSPEMPAVLLHRPARLNAGADFDGLEIESLPGNRCGELLNHRHRFRLRPPHWNKVTGADGDYPPKLASLPRHPADEQAGVP